MSTTATRSASGTPTATGVLKPISSPATVVKLAKAGIEVFVEVKIAGQDVEMLVDTGAEHTLIDAAVAKAAHLADVSSAVTTTSIACTSSSQPVRITDWSIAGQALPPGTVLSQVSTLAAKNINGKPFGGFLGSDLFGAYGALTVDFTQGRIALGGAPASGASTIPVQVVAKKGAVAMIAAVTLHGVQVGLVVDTGASASSVDDSVATQAKLSNVGASVKVGAVSCTTTAQPVTLDNWTIGSVKLPEVVGISSDNRLESASNGKVDGLLGADVLSTYGLATFDHKGARLILGEAEK